MKQGLLQRPIPLRRAGMKKQAREVEQTRDGAVEREEEMLLPSASLGNWLASLSRPTFIAGHQVGQSVASTGVLSQFGQCFHW